MKKIVVLGLLALSSSLFADYRCVVEDMCTPFYSPFTIKESKGFVEFPELTGDRKILGRENIEDSVVFSMEGGFVQIVHDTSFDTPFGGWMEIDGDRVGVTCELMHQN